MNTITETKSSFLGKSQDKEGCCGGCTGNSALKGLTMTPDEIDKTFKMIAQTMANLEAVMGSMEMKAERRHYSVLQSLGEHGLRVQEIEMRLHSMEQELNSLKENKRVASFAPPGMSQEMTLQTHEPRIDRSGCTVTTACRSEDDSTGSSDCQQDAKGSRQSSAGKKSTDKKSKKKSSKKKSKESYSLRASSASTDQKSRSVKSKTPSTTRSTPVSSSKLSAGNKSQSSSSRKGSSKGVRKQRK